MTNTSVSIVVGETQHQFNISRDIIIAIEQGVFNVIQAKAHNKNELDFMLSLICTLKCIKDIGSTTTNARKANNVYNS